MSIVKNLFSATCLLFTVCVLLVGCDATSGSSGMQTTTNGFQLKMIKDVDSEGPAIDDMVLYGMKVFAKDSLLNSTYGQEYSPEFKWIPEEDRNKIKNPVMDAFGQMTKGDSVVVYFPADSMKGNTFGLVSGENLVYVVKMIDVMNAERYATYAAERQQKMQAQKAKLQERADEIGDQITGTLADYKSGKLGANLIKDVSGLEYVIHEKGSGALPAASKKVFVNYYGVLKDTGAEFDNSFKRGKEFDFALGMGRVIQGWDKGIALLPKGSKATLFIPYDMAYGATERPGIPAKSDLVFYVEVLDK